MLRLARSHVRAFIPSTPSACLNVHAIANASANSTAIGTATRPSTITCNHLYRQQQCRGVAKGKVKTVGEVKKVQRLMIEHCKAVHALAQELQETGVWFMSDANKTGPKKKAKSKKTKSGKTTSEDAKPKPRGDRTRINIVNPNVVRDAIEYIKPSLARHHGCDLISVYPGAGLWSKALHDAVQPRSHLLLEPDEGLYTPFLEPLLTQPGVRLVPKSGIVWNELNEILTPEYLPHQVEIPRSFDGPIPQNDTLLVSINLAMYPKKRFSTFDSLSRMVLYQLVSSMRSSSLFQKYGRVRMLMWIPNDEKEGLLPRILHHRTRLATEGELCTEYIAEVCGEDNSAVLAGKGTSSSNGKEKSKSSDEDKTWNTKRWGQLDMESMRLTLNRMRQANLETPPGQESFFMQQFLKLGLSLDEPVDPDKYLTFSGRQTDPELEALEQMEKEAPMDHKSPEWQRMSKIMYYHRRLDRDLVHAQNYLKGYRELLALQNRFATATDPDERERLGEELRLSEESWDKAFRKMPGYLAHTVTNARDNFHLLEQPPELGPVLNWDRRPYEPLPLRPDDFFPNIPCALLDIQPKVPDPLLRSMGPGSTKSGDIFDLIMSVFLLQRRKPVVQLLDNLWPGTHEYVYPRCPSLRDPAQGGVPLSNWSSISARVLNQVQLMEILRTFMAWPFRPPYSQMVGRHGEDKGEDILGMGDEESPVGGAQGGAMIGPF